MTEWVRVQLERDDGGDPITPLTFEVPAPWRQYVERVGPLHMFRDRYTWGQMHDMARLLAFAQAADDGATAYLQAAAYHLASAERCEMRKLRDRIDFFMKKVCE
jgi:hypothetical protein